MSQLAQRLQLSDHCGADLQMENPMVVQAYNGFMAYDPLYHAGCLKETDGSFCYANAISNVTLAGSSFVYYLPLGVELPGSTQLSCTPCLRNTMSAFSTFASDSKQALSTDYAMAASQIDMSCGPRFAKASVQVNAAVRLPGHQSNLGIAALLIGLFFLFS